MLTVYRRHIEACKHAESRDSKQCRCPLWATGTLEGKPYRRSLKTRSFERADKLKRKIEDGETPEKALPTIAIAIKKFLLDAEHGRKLKPPTIKKYRVLLDQLETFATKKNITEITAIDVDLCREFRQSWTDGAISSVKKLERLRAFCRFLSVSGWLGSNPALSVSVPQTDEVPTLPFSDQEMADILKEANDPRWHALIQVLRWAGLRIGDAMELSTEKIDGNTIFLRMAKTKVPVRVPIPEFVIQELKALPTYGNYFFWKREGNSKVDTATGNARRSLRKIFAAAKIEPYDKEKKTSEAHPHRFRDTFAVGLLLAGVPLEHVSMLLGHRSVKVTEKHYSPWVRSRQENLERAVAGAWPKAELVLVKKSGRASK